MLQFLGKSRGGEIGRRAGLKIQWGQPRAGSSPALGTIDIYKSRMTLFLYLKMIYKLKKKLKCVKIRGELVFFTEKDVSKNYIEGGDR